MELSEGFHRFRIRLIDIGGNVANNPRSPLLFSVNGGKERRFDEDSLLLSIAPYGYIGGELALEEGSDLENDAESPCEVAGTLTGTGTLKGKFRLSGATWKIPMLSRSRGAQGVRFETPDEMCLAGVGKLSFSFDESPLLFRYVVGPALGLADTPEKLAERVEVSVPGEPFPYKGMKPVIENGTLMNLRPKSTMFIIK